jgi:hypothetical protein
MTEYLGRRIVKVPGPSVLVTFVIPALTFLIGGGLNFSINI